MTTTRASRREFLKMAAVTGAAAGAGRRVTGAEANAESWRRVSKQVSPNDRIQIALIGAGGQGQYDTQSALEIPGVELIASADVYDGRLVHVKERFGADVDTTRDYTEILARDDVDAIIIGTPDHWHKQIAIEAMDAGKDVYVEKPMMQKVEEGAELVAAQTRTGRILQVGSQRVSSVLYEHAKQIYESGRLGELNMIEAWWDRNSAIGAWQYTIPPDASPETVDWARFLGAAPSRSFDAKRMFRWRNYQDYGTGVAGDLFVHLFSGLHYIVSAIGPTRVFATGGLRYWKDGRDVPDVMLGLYDYPATDSHPEFTLALRVNFADGAAGGSGFRFVGSDAVMSVGGSVGLTRRARQQSPGYSINTFPNAMQNEFLEDYKRQYPNAERELTPQADEVFRAPNGYNDQVDHFGNFFASVRSREPVIEDATFGFRAAGPAVLSNVSYSEKKTVHWDPESMRVTG
ncbi:MAG: Gfo/Idh/MocA family oxidoreductase [Vicinamibacterales bacterium]|nr:Gfo/Idh/MocA family oxidoreductase [Vicinamibacterales bacterium]